MQVESGKWVAGAAGAALIAVGLLLVKFLACGREVLLRIEVVATMNANEMQDEFCRRVNTSTNRLLENYRTLLQSSHVGNETGGHERLQVETAAANIVYACESLLDQVQELRMHVILQDMPEIANELREERKELKKRYFQGTEETSSRIVEWMLL